MKREDWGLLYYPPHLPRGVLDLPPPPRHLPIFWNTLSSLGDFSFPLHMDGTAHVFLAGSPWEDITLGRLGTLENLVTWKPVLPWAWLSTHC